MEKEIKKIEKIVVNAGIGRLSGQAQFEEKILPAIMGDLSTITGQKPSTRPAKKSIASFKIREGQVVGLAVTLRRKKMADFLNRLVNLALPRVKDFRGLDLGNVDGQGNLNIGFREQTVFPEIDPEKAKVSFGLQVTLVPRAKNREKAIDLYRSLGVPLKREK
ncbi:50S ribosomal protein L5 [Patescibacteria group bacterium]|nr:50S ribosomal protein L5 [Patescibacteria group bacterium]